MLTPPPVAPSLVASSFQTTSEEMVEPLPWSLVPPQARTCGLEAGKSTWFWPPVTPSVEPLSPAATVMVMPSAAADWQAASRAVMDWAVQLDFGRAPADGDDAGFVFGVVDGGADGVDEALVGVGGEVDDDVGAGSDGGGDFNVEHDFAVGAVGVGGAVLAAVDEDCGDCWGLLAEGFEVGGEVGGLVAAAQLDDADGLACGGCVGWELVELLRPAAGCRRCSALPACGWAKPVPWAMFALRSPVSPKTRKWGWA